MNVKRIETNLIEQTVSLSKEDESRLSEIRMKVLENKEKESFLFKPAYASVLLILPLFFLQWNNSSILGSNDYSSVIDIAYIGTDSEVESIYDLSDDEYSEMLLVASYEEKPIDFYYQ